MAGTHAALWSINTVAGLDLLILCGTFFAIEHLDFNDDADNKTCSVWAIKSDVVVEESFNRFKNKPWSVKAALAQYQVDGPEKKVEDLFLFSMLLINFTLMASYKWVLSIKTNDFEISRVLFWFH